MVYVLNCEGHPLMPTENHAKVRILLKRNKAKIVKKIPFTIQLQYKTKNCTQAAVLGVDAGSKKVGISVTTKNKVLFESEIELRNNISLLLMERKEYRYSRRFRKTRYRKQRFRNRLKGKGWLAPSVRQKIETHLNVVDKVTKLLPISKIIVETASFDIQKIKNPNISGKEYCNGDQFGFANVRAYVLWRDNYMCQCCKGKSNTKILNVHHIESRKTGGNAPNNLITLCTTCHKAYHNGDIQLPNTIKRGKSYKDGAFMGIMRWAFFDKLKEKYSNVEMTYGYITKAIRIQNNLPKEHYIDARCISGNPKAVSNGEIFYYKKIRCHNRKIHKQKIFKNGVKRRNQAEHVVFGFRLFDEVLYRGIRCFIFGRRATGRMDLRLIDNTYIKSTASYKELKLLNINNNYIGTKIKKVLKI